MQHLWHMRSHAGAFAGREHDHETFSSGHLVQVRLFRKLRNTPNSPAGPWAKGRLVRSVAASLESGNRRILLTFSMIRPPRGSMAVELMQPEPGSLNPRRGVRELGSLLWVCGWGCITAIALVALAITSQTETAGERLRHIFSANESSAVARMPSRIIQLESETQILAAQIRTLSTERDRLAGRIALLENTIDDMTGTIKKQAAATAAALAAGAAPAPSRSASAPSMLPDSSAINAGVTATRVTTIAITRSANAADNRPAAADPAATDALRDHDRQRSGRATCEPERIWIGAWRRRHHRSCETTLDGS